MRRGQSIDIKLLWQMWSATSTTVRRFVLVNRAPLSQASDTILRFYFAIWWNSTSIATQLDPEEWREIVAEYHCIAALASNGLAGISPRYLGDGVMVFFGRPGDARERCRACGPQPDYSY
jgi:hypothetical protein